MPEDHNNSSSSTLRLTVELNADPNPLHPNDFNKLSNVLVNDEKSGSLSLEKVGMCRVFSFHLLKNATKQWVYIVRGIWLTRPTSHLTDEDTRPYVKQLLRTRWRQNFKRARNQGLLGFHLLWSSTQSGKFLVAHLLDLYCIYTANGNRARVVPC